MKHRQAQSAVRWILTIAVVVTLLAAGAVLAMRLLRPAVVVSEPVQAPVVQAFYSTGTVSPEREFPIRSNTAGILTEVRVDKGSRVKQGDVLAVVTDTSLIFLADKAKAELNEKLKRADSQTSPVLQEFDARISATAELLASAQREQTRVTNLLERSAASQTDLDRAFDRVKETWRELETLKAQRAAKQLELDREVEVAQSAAAIAQWNLEEQTLRAPVDGVVLDRPTARGTRVAVNDQIMRIADVTPERLVMRAAVDEEDISRVQLEQVVRMSLYAFPGEVFAGRVTQIYDQADPDRRTFEVDVRLNPPDGRLFPGMTGELAFILAEKPRALVIPSQAVQDGAVWVVRSGRLQRTTPLIGISSVERVEVIEGLEPGEQVVITPVGTMQPGQTVRTSYLDPATAAGLNKVEIEEQPFKAFD